MPGDVRVPSFQVGEDCLDYCFNDIISGVVLPMGVLVRVHIDVNGV